MKELRDALVAQIEAFDGRVRLCLRCLQSGETISYDADGSDPIASMIKLPILIALFRRVAEGALTLDTSITLQESDLIGGAGILRHLSPAREESLHDLAVMMMALSDNVAANALIRVLSIPYINETIAALGMKATRLHNPIDFAMLQRDQSALAVGSPEDFVHLLTQLWHRRILTPAACARIIEIMRIQTYTERMNRHLPLSPYIGAAQDVWVASKTGGLRGIKVEAGIVKTPQRAWALCVLTCDSPDPRWSSLNDGTTLIARLAKLIFTTLETQPSPP